jgi:tetratricopeptide (TPR) repeat protein
MIGAFAPKLLRSLLLISAVLLVAFAPGCAQAQPQAAAGNRGVKVLSPNAPGNNDTWKHHQDYALLFAANDYDDPTWPHLINPIPDAQAIAEELKENYGFRIEIVTNPTREEIVTKIREYIQKAFAESDQLFIFFAGHGFFDDVFGQGYIVARDSRIADETRGTYLSYSDLLPIINQIHAKHIFWAVDACYSGTLDRRIREAGARGVETYANFSFPELFDNKSRLTTRKYLTSGGKDYVPDGDPGKHSPFAAHLLETLRGYGGKKGYLTFEDVLAGVEWTKPEPVWGEFGGNDVASEFFFLSKQLAASLGNPKQSSIEAPAESTVETSRGNAVRPSVAVLGFGRRGGNADDDWLSTALPIWLTTELGAGENLRTIAEETVARAKADLGLPETDGYAKNTLARIYKALGSEYVVSGSFSVLGNPPASTLRIDLRMQNAATGEMVGEASEAGKPAELPELAAHAANKLRARLGIRAPSESETAAAKAALPAGVEAARLYAQGLSLLRKYDLLAAKDKLDRAVASDPESALAHLALARTLQELGYDGKAAQEAKSALDLAGGLSVQDGSAVKATYWQMTAKWDQAIEIYRALVTLFPDEIDYALELAEVQTDAAKGQDALSTLDALRQSSEAKDDPRIDLREALAAAKLSDFRRQKAAAAKAAQEASSQGARLLAAEAYWQDCDALVSLGDLPNAETACQQANQFSDSAGGRKVKARSLTVLAEIKEKQGSNSEAMELRQEALALAMQIGSRKDIAGALLNLANLQSSQNQIEAAQKGYEEGLRIARESGDKEHLGKLQIAFAGLRYTEGEYDSAREMYESALAIVLDIGDKQQAVEAYQALGLVLFQLGDLTNARKQVDRALTLARETGSDAARAYSLSMLGDILLVQADLPGAHGAYEEALALSTRLDNRQDIAANRLSLANLALEEGGTQAAETLARQAAEEFQREKNVDSEADARDIIARVLMQHGKLTEASAEIEAAMRLSPEERSIRLTLAATAARINALRGQSADARQALLSALAEASRLRLVGCQFEIRLAQAEIEGISNPVSARTLLQALEADAKRAGYLLIAAKAARPPH